MNPFVQFVVAAGVVIVLVVTGLVLSAFFLSSRISREEEDLQRGWGENL